MEENVKENQPISIVDPEAHSMLDKNGEWGFNYNFQSGVDDEYGMIAVHYITQSPNDQKELLITVKELNERLGKKDYIIVVDHGYWHIKSLKETYNSPTTVIIPDRAAASSKKDKSKKKQKKKSKIKIDEKFRKDKFFKDWHNDVYICPNGLTLTRMNNICKMALNIMFMGQIIVLLVQIRKNALQNPKGKSKIEANQKSMKSKKFITQNGVKKFIQEEVQMLKEILEHY